MNLNSKWEVTKLDYEPIAAQMTDCGIAEHHIERLGYKQTEAMTAKGIEAKPTAYYVVPDLEVLFPLAADEGMEIPLAMAYDALGKIVRKCLFELDDGIDDAKKRILDMQSLAAWYFLDGRGDGIKQEQIQDWIEDVLGPMLQRRIERNLSTESKTKRDGLVASLVFSFQVAATRGNSIRVKGSNKSCTMAVLKDLQSRLAAYVAEDELAICDELTALQNKIAAHLVTTVEVVESVPQF